MRMLRLLRPIMLCIFFGYATGYSSNLAESTNSLPGEGTIGFGTSGTSIQGCGKPGFTSGTYTMEHGGLTRSYRLHVPAGYNANKATRLVTIFHGWGSDENEFLNDQTVIAEADARGYILVAPRGLGSGAPDFSRNSWSFRGSTTGLDGDGVNPAIPRDTDAICDPSITPDYSYASCSDIASNTCAWTHCQADDVAFALALVDEIKENLCVDEKNVFATGGSNGGMFTWELGKNPASAPTYRAIAPLIGLPHRGYNNGPGKTGDLPALVITGTKDATVPPGSWDNENYTQTTDGDRYYYTSATGITKAWAAAHGCNTDEMTDFDDGHIKTTCGTYCGDDAGWPRVLDCRANMGHDYSFRWSWPLIMEFFDQHTAH